MVVVYFSDDCGVCTRDENGECILVGLPVAFRKIFVEPCNVSGTKVAAWVNNGLWTR